MHHTFTHPQASIISPLHREGTIAASALRLSVAVSILSVMFRAILKEKISNAMFAINNLRGGNSFRQSRRMQMDLRLFLEIHYNAIQQYMDR